MDPDSFAALHDALDETDIFASVTVKDGVIIDEYYKPGYSSESVFPLHSCSKSFTAVLLGLALEQGYIDSIDDLASSYLPEILEKDSARLKKVTLRHLLTHTSGISWDEATSDSMFFDWYTSENWVDYVLSRPVTSEPGARFNYSTGGTHLLAAIFQSAVGRTLFDFGREYLFDPLDMDSVRWGSDPQGITDGGNGIRMNVYDMAKFGQLMLDGGMWQGEQVIPADWVAECTKIQVQRPAGYASYGYQFWVRSFAGYDCFFAQGFGGQLIFVCPSLDLVSVFTSNVSTHDPWGYFADYVLAAAE